MQIKMKSKKATSLIWDTISLCEDLRDDNDISSAYFDTFNRNFGNDFELLNQMVNIVALFAAENGSKSKVTLNDEETEVINTIRVFFQ